MEPRDLNASGLPLREGVDLNYFQHIYPTGIHCLPLREGVDLNVCSATDGQQRVNRLPLREGVDLNVMLLGHTLTQGGLPLREGVDLNVDLWGETEGGKTSPSA